MKRYKTQFDQRLDQQQAEQKRAASETQVIEFFGPDEALRYDAAHTTVPQRVAERLRESIRHEPRQRDLPWWRRVFGS